MGRRRRTTTTEPAPDTTTTDTTTTSGGMDGGGGGMDGGGGGGGGGMGGGACYIYTAAGATPGLTNADVTFNLGIDMQIPLTMDDGRTVNMWGFSDNGGNMGGMGGGGGGMGGGTFPSPAMRVTEGDIVHSVLNVGMMMAHTIHHHGIEPEYRSDGVGHLSWDVNGGYTYQWRPASAGTYFYHCHTNTVLHAEMGMYGALIVDPPEGAGTLFSGGPRYDAEVVWAVDEIDSSWHNLPWDAGTCGGDVGLNELNPDYFVITGIDGSGNSAMNAAGVAATVQRGDRLLARYICAGYHPQRIRFGGLTGRIYASDGRPLPNPVSVTSIRAASAERYDIIFEPTSRGTYVIETDIIHWVTGQVLGTTRTSITVV